MSPQIKLSPTLQSSPRRYLVFTSAGDASSLATWLAPERSFDLWVCYYGDGARDFSGVADIYCEMKGAKFPNLQQAGLRWPELLWRYDAILVLDDDIEITAAGIDRLFRIRAEHDFWIVQPAFHPSGKNSHAINVRRPGSYLRYVNFIEEGVPLFRADKLRLFLAAYDPAHSAYCVDKFYVWLIGGAESRRLAVIDAVCCRNPYAFEKPGRRRELERLESRQDLVAGWLAVRDRHGINFKFSDLRVLATVWASWPARGPLLLSGWYQHHRARLRRYLMRLRGRALT